MCQNLFIYLQNLESLNLIKNERRRNLRIKVFERILLDLHFEIEETHLDLIVKFKVVINLIFENQ